MELVIHTIAASTWTRYDRWRVEMEIVGEKKRVCWLTPAQYDYLLSAFQHTRNGYSDNSVSVVGVFDDENGYYIRCRAERVAQPHKHHTPLITEATIDDSLRDH